MLYNLLVPLSDDYQIFNLFRYLTFRTGGAIMTALLIGFVLGPWLIDWLRSKQREGQPIREDGPESHLLTKKGTPTMGGLLILIALSVSTLLWADLSNGFIWAVLVVTGGFGLLGFADDFLKLTKRNTKGLPGKIKLLGQIAISIVAVLMIQDSMPANLANGLAVPFFKDVLIDLGWFFAPFAIFVMVGASNAVNLTDGLDGLAIGPVMTAAGEGSGSAAVRRSSSAWSRLTASAAAMPWPVTSMRTTRVGPSVVEGGKARGRTKRKSPPMERMGS